MHAGSTGSLQAAEPGQGQRCAPSDPTEVWVQAAILRPVVAYLHIKKFITPLLLPHCSFFFLFIDASLYVLGSGSAEKHHFNIDPAASGME